MTDYCEKLNCNNGKAFRILSPILPCQSVTETTINGKSATVIKLLNESPIWQVARLKNQFLTFDTRLLNVPNQNNTKMNIEIKNYVMHRIVEIKAHKMVPTLTFDDIFAKCRLENISRKKKFDVRDAISVFLTHLERENFIKSFNFVKRGNAIYAVQFSYSESFAEKFLLQNRRKEFTLSKETSLEGR